LASKGINLHLPPSKHMGGGIEKSVTLFADLVTLKYTWNGF
jgi:hypothetical protein